MWLSGEENNSETVKRIDSLYSWSGLILITVVYSAVKVLRTNSRYSKLWHLRVSVATLAANLAPAMGDNLALVITFIFLSSLVIAANLTVCVIVYQRKSMRTYTNGFVVSLAFSDLLIGSVLIPAALVSLASPAMDYLVSITLLSGVFNLAAVTFDRFVSVLKALQYENIMRKNFTRMIIASWLLAILISLIPLIWNTDNSMLVHKIYIFSVSALCVLLPFAFIFTGYFKIFQQVKRSVKREKAITASVRKTLDRKNKNSSEAKLAQVFVIVAVMFVLSWLPVQYMTIVYEIGRPDLIPSDLSIVSMFTIALGSLVNPIVYSFLKPDFRKAIRHIFHRRKRFAGNGSAGASLKSITTSSYRSRFNFTRNTASTRVW